MAIQPYIHQVQALIKASKTDGQGGQSNAVLLPRELVRFLGDYEAAAMLAQIFYWTERTTDPDGWFYKTAEEWESEICLTAAQVRRVSQVLARHGLVEIAFKKNPRHGNAPVYHYRLSWPAFVAAFSAFLRSLHIVEVEECGTSTMCTPDIEESATSMDIAQSASSLKGITSLQHKPTTTSLHESPNPQQRPAPQPSGGGNRKQRPEPERPNRTPTFIWLAEDPNGPMLGDVPTLNKCAGLDLAGVQAEWERTKARGKGGGWLAKVILDPGWKAPEVDPNAARQAENLRRQLDYAAQEMQRNLAIYEQRRAERKQQASP